MNSIRDMQSTLRRVTAFEVKGDGYRPVTAAPVGLDQRAVTAIEELALQLIEMRRAIDLIEAKLDSQYEELANVHATLQRIAKLSEPMAYRPVSLDEQALRRIAEIESANRQFLQGTFSERLTATEVMIRGGGGGGGGGGAGAVGSPGDQGRRPWGEKK